MAGSPLKKARRLVAAARQTDPLDEMAARPSLDPIPWNNVELTEEQLASVAQALAARRTDAEIAIALNVSQADLRRMIKDNLALTEAVKGSDQAELEEIRSLLLAHGRTGDTVALIFLGKAFHGLRDREEAKPKVEAKMGGVLLLPSNVSLEEWDAAAAAQQAQYRDGPDFETFGCR